MKQTMIIPAWKTVLLQYDLDCDIEEQDFLWQLPSLLSNSYQNGEISKYRYEMNFSRNQIILSVTLAEKKPTLLSKIINGFKKLSC